MLKLSNLGNCMRKLNSEGVGLILLLIISSVITFIAISGYFIYETRRSDANQDSSDYSCDQEIGDCVMPLKPVIYLYPTKEQELSVKLDYKGKLVSTYPDYDYYTKGWQVTAQPDGTLINKADGKEYSYLFWEGKDQTQYDTSTGFVVKGSDTKEFLQNTLSKIGLTPREYNEMIVFWLPRMENNKYNLIHFAGEDYTSTAKLTVTPTPDSVLRVFMVYKPLDKYQQVKAQEIMPFNRHGFAVVEWGGSEIK